MLALKNEGKEKERREGEGMKGRRRNEGKEKE